jgi:hypothetical protein
MKEPDRRHRALLRARRQRPRRRTAESRDEVAPFHSLMPPVLRTERIAHLGTEETAALRDFDAAYARFGVKIGLCGDVRCMTAFPLRTDIRRHA